MQNNWRPLTRKIIQTKDGQPDVGSPKIRVLIIIMIIIKNAIKQKRTPKTDDKTNGTVEKAVIPSKEYLKSFQNDHFVSPATLFTFS